MERSKSKHRPPRTSRGRKSPKDPRGREDPPASTSYMSAVTVTRAYLSRKSDLPSLEPKKREECSLPSRTPFVRAEERLPHHGFGGRRLDAVVRISEVAYVFLVVRHTQCAVRIGADEACFLYRRRINLWRVISWRARKVEGGKRGLIRDIHALFSHYWAAGGDFRTRE
ncbi:hypothetical protein MAPG_07400 [Magnaporthiopsis poae ATCC 64411]|uniref:Uncharacterized protein n=1 Tax=Magnaporthiopsis poae (strain ATCC 64411 / 73-15) TaxID=644358 RepID=A0A0C4E4K4_MAGP6|nr:hypothetical protein MAPG_07400 [Magnaporthiopsis poae ATCC 64411]